MDMLTQALPPVPRPPERQCAGDGSEFELGMIVAWNAFSRWSERCMSAAGAPALAMTEIVLLGHILQHGRGKKLADICFALNFSDTHVVSYGLRKLVAMKLAVAGKIGKEVSYTPTQEGEAVMAAYWKMRSSCLLPCLDAPLSERLATSAQALRQMSGIYDQAARSAGSM